MMVIVLQASDVVAASGPSSEMPALSTLAPIMLTDGRGILGLGVLTDPLHAEHQAALAALPQVDISTLAALLPTVEG